MNENRDPEQSHDIVGILPMAGRATRLGKMTCSKEVLPLNMPSASGLDPAPQVVADIMLEKMRNAGIERIYIIIRDGKWDIPAALGDGSRSGIHLSYLMMGLPYGTPYSLDQALPFCQNAIVALGFPDMLMAEHDVFTPLLACLDDVNADIVLGLFPTDRPEKTDMVELDDDNRVRRIVVKPSSTSLQYCWGIAVWKPVFSRFMHQYLINHKKTAEHSPELYVGHVIQHGVESGLNVHAVPVSTRPFLDIGTPEDLGRLRSYLSALD